MDCFAATDGTSCLGGCLPEGSCTEADGAELAGLVQVASLDNRAGLVAMLVRATAPCASCILATIGHVCGPGCIEARTHLSTERFLADRLLVRPCLPALASRLIADQSQKLAAAAAAAVPFSLVAAAEFASPPASDLFVPTGKFQYGLAVYRGTDTGRYAFACDPAITGGHWALSATDDATAWSRCDGELWLDGQSNRLSAARPAAPASAAAAGNTEYVRGSSAMSDAVPVVYRFNFDSCAAYLPAAVTSNEPVVRFAAGVQAEEIACWFAQVFGPQATSEPLPEAIELPEGLGTVTLLTDLVVRRSKALRVEGRNATLIVGGNRLVVEHDARLDLHRVTVTDSVGSSALWVYGTAVLTECTFRNCLTTTTSLRRHLEDAVPNKRGGYLTSQGGAVYVGSDAILNASDSSFVGCAAAGAPSSNIGGAICVDLHSQLRLDRCQLAENTASGGEIQAAGGGVYLAVATAFVTESTFSFNAARGGGQVTEGAAMALYENSRAEIAGSKFVGNRVTESKRVQGGAIAAKPKTQLIVTMSWFSRNSATNASDQASGGALFVEAECVISDSYIEQNEVAVGNSVAGGGIALDGAANATIRGTSLAANRALTGVSSTMGGAIYAAAGVRSVRMHGSDMRNNSAEGPLAAGGALHTAALRVELGESIFTHNRAEASSGSDAFGGALFAQSAESISSVASALLHNRAVVGLGDRDHRASGGGAYLATGVKACVITSSKFALNSAGGAAFYGRTDDLERNRARSAAQIHVSAKAARLVNCTMDDEGRNGEAGLPNAAAWWIVVDNSGGVVLVESAFRSSTGPQGLLILPSTSGGAIVRGCVGQNMTLESNAGVNSVGLVNSSFVPPLDASLGSAVVAPSPDCGREVVVGEDPVCDLRATCAEVVSGLPGVRCTCDSEGLSFKPGYVPDGARCEQALQVVASLQSPALRLKVVKPGRHRDVLTLKVASQGEAVFDVSFTPLSGLFNRTCASLPDLSWGLARHRSRNGSAFGQHLEWSTAPATPGVTSGEPAASTALDPSSASLAQFEHRFGVSLRCDNASTLICPADGEIIQTAMQFEHTAWVRSTVMLMMEVQSRPSCQRSTAKVVRDGGESHLAPIVVTLESVDVDSLPIAQTSTEFSLLYDGAPFPYEGSPGTNGYKATVPTLKSSRPGTHELVVVLLNGHNESSDGIAMDNRCELLRQLLVVVCGAETAEVEGECKPIVTSNIVQIAVGAVIATLLAGLVAILVYMAYRNPGRAQEIVFSVMSIEAVLFVEGCFEIWDFVSDYVVFAQFQQKRGRPWVDRLTIPYTTFFATSCAVSAASFGIKARLIWLGLRSRVSEARPISLVEAYGSSSSDHRRASAVQKLARSVSREKSELISDLHAQMFSNTIARWTYYCYFGAAVFEDIPMGTLSAYFVFRSVHECLTQATAVESQKYDVHCDLKPNQTMLALASVVTSFASLAFKAARKRSMHATSLRVRLCQRGLSSGGWPCAVLGSSDL
jgi:hypothetical protein